MNDKKIVALLALSVILAAIAGKLIIDSRSSTITTNQPNATVASLQEEYAGLPAEHVVVRESPSAVINRFNEGSGIIFLGFKECPWCQKLLPIANEVAAAEGEKIYYLDIRAAREGNTSEYQQLISILAPHLKKDEDGSPRIYVPDMSIVRDGAIVDRYKMDETEGDELTPDSYWTDARKLQAQQTLRNQIHELRKKVTTEDK